MIKTNRSTLSHGIQHTLTRRAAATTRFSAETDGAKVFANIRLGGPLPRKHSPDGATWADIR